MKQNNTKFLVADNSGAKIIKQIQINKKTGTITSCTKKAITSSKIKKGQIVSVKLIKKKFKTQRQNGLFMKFKNSAVILTMTEKKGIKAIGSRAKGCFDKNLNIINLNNNILLANTNQY